LGHTLAEVGYFHSLRLLRADGLQAGYGGSIAVQSRDSHGGLTFFVYCFDVHAQFD